MSQTTGHQAAVFPFLVSKDGPVFTVSKQVTETVPLDPHMSPHRFGPVKSLDGPEMVVGTTCFFGVTSGVVGFHLDANMSIFCGTFIYIFCN